MDETELLARKKRAEEYVRANPEFRYARLPVGEYKTDTKQICYVIGVFRLEASFMTEERKDDGGKKIMKTNATLVDFVMPDWMKKSFEMAEFDNMEWSTGSGVMLRKGRTSFVPGLYETVEDATFDEHYVERD